MEVKKELRSEQVACEQSAQELVLVQQKLDRVAADPAAIVQDLARARQVSGKDEVTIGNLETEMRAHRVALRTSRDGDEVTRPRRDG